MGFSEDIRGFSGIERGSMRIKGDSGGKKGFSEFKGFHGD